MKLFMRRVIPASIISNLLYFIYLLRDILDHFLLKRDPLVPPKRLMFDGPRDTAIFKKNGEEFFRYYREFCDLKPYEKILDVGCGIGRKTIPLLAYLNHEGRYEGFDIVPAGINWCIKNISAKYPNFHFQLADIYNKYYNPKGRYRAFEYRFPYENGSFDFVALGSVFTHMLPADMENYLSEIARVLKLGGRCLITYFLLNEESLMLINDKRCTLDFMYDMGVYRVVHPQMQEDAVCYDEKFILELYKKYGLTVNGPIHYGSWYQRQDFLSYQDIIIAVKEKEYGL